MKKAKRFTCCDPAALRLSFCITCDPVFISGSPLSWRWNTEVVLWEPRQRPAAVAPRRDRLTPPQLHFVIGSAELKDTVQHLTRLNECKMSNQRRVWSSRAASSGLLPARPSGADPCPRVYLRSDTGTHHTSHSLNIAADSSITAYGISPLWKLIPVDSLSSTSAGLFHLVFLSLRITGSHTSYRCI